MARQKRRSARSAEAPEDHGVDLGDLGRQVGTFETNNGLAHGIIGTALVVLAVLVLRPVSRAFRAFIRG